MKWVYLALWGVMSILEIYFDNVSPDAIYIGGSAMLAAMLAVTWKEKPDR